VLGGRNKGDCRVIRIVYKKKKGGRNTRRKTGIWVFQKGGRRNGPTENGGENGHARKMGQPICVGKKKGMERKWQKKGCRKRFSRENGSKKKSN